MSITIESKIASGSSGSIFKIISQKNGVREYQALKISPNQRGIIKNLLEIILHYNTCPYLINSIDYEIDHNVKKIYMPLGLCNTTRLYKYKVDIVKILYQICLGVKYLHDLSIVHGDIKPSNILLFKNNGEYTVKLSDFNLSYICLNKIKGILSYTNGYRAPEVMESNEYDLKSDIWALGQTLRKIVSLGDYNIDVSNFNSLIKGMLEIEPEKRWDINQVLESDFFKEVLVKEVSLKEVFKESSFTKVSLNSSLKSYNYENLNQDLVNFVSRLNFEEINLNDLQIIVSKLFGKYYMYFDINLINLEIMYCKILITFFQLYIFKS
jgi:serine/threonine protein kinase